MILFAMISPALFPLVGSYCGEYFILNPPPHRQFPYVKSNAGITFFYRTLGAQGSYILHQSVHQSKLSATCSTKAIATKYTIRL